VVQGKDNITAVFIAHNEEQTIKTSIEAVLPYVNEVIVVDMESTDSTTILCKSLGVTKIIPHKNVENFGISRLVGIDHCNTNWVFILDADEVVTESLMEKIHEVIDKDSADFIHIPRANYAFGGVVLHEGGFPEYQARCFKKSHCLLSEYMGDLHDQFKSSPNARVLYLPGRFPSIALHHYTNLTVTDFLNKLNSYSTIEMQERITRLKPNFFSLIVRPLKLFLSHYIKRKGYKDGWRGFGLSIMLAHTEIMINIKMFEALEYGGVTPDKNAARLKMINSTRNE
jgi:glycosyltransferase involved in cell wall biosynthesis